MHGSTRSRLFAYGAAFLEPLAEPVGVSSLQAVLPMQVADFPQGVTGL
jgi:hypothetical protein